MAELKKKKKGHDHSLTDWLKFIIFGCVMLAPFFAILTKCCYVAWNPNAQESYSGTYNYQTTMKLSTYCNTEVVTDTEYTVNDNIMHQLNASQLSGFTQNVTNYTIGMYTLDINSGIIINVENLRIENTNYPNAKSIFIGKVNYLYGNTFIAIFNNTYVNNTYIEINANMFINVKDENGITVYNSVESIILINGNGGTLHRKNIEFNNVSNYIYYKTSKTPLQILEKNIFYTDATLSNVFYTSLEDINNAPIFNWTESTGMYTVINNMTQDLEFGTSGNTLATLLTYWSLNTAIYIIFDIIIWAFTKITHILQE